ncbi:MAG TPA: branched-chain amino acid ABC transporter permease, partial [Rhodopila sp.]|nr:branched-chain amino acid ABC transporter permease [Rhodopila sp.]
MSVTTSSSPTETAAPPATAATAQPRPWLTTGIIWLLLLTVPLWLPLLGGYTALAGRVLVLGLAAMSFNLLLGFTGIMSFGHAAYFGLGAYGAGLVLKYVTASTPLAILAGLLLGGVIGTLFGSLIVRRRGVYFAMVTVAFGQIAFYVAYSWDSLTGGYDGLRGFSRAPINLGFMTLDIANSGTAFYYFLLLVFAVATGLQGLLLASPFGRTLVAIRENERRARFLGIPIERHIW